MTKSDVTSPTSPTSAAPWRRLPDDLPIMLRPRLDATVKALAHQLVAAVPEFAERPRAAEAKFQRDLRSGVRTALERFLDLVGTTEPALTRSVRETFVALGAAEARDEQGPGALASALRIAARQLLRTSWEVLARTRAVSAEEMLDLSDAVTTYHDELLAAATQGYTLQLREQAGEGDRRRQYLAGLLLRGGAAESTVRATAEAIGWPGLDAVTAVLLPSDQARDARFRYSADGVVVERDRDAVLLVRDGPRAARGSLTDTLRGRGAVVGPALPWPRLPVAVRLAELTARLVRPDPAPDVAPVFAEDHLATLVVHGAPGALDVLTSRRLAALSGLREAQRARLLETLRSWLLHWGSRTDVAADLYVHPQTVTYRLRRLRDLFGDALDDPRARFELLLVLGLEE